MLEMFSWSWTRWTGSVNYPGTSDRPGTPPLAPARDSLCHPERSAGSLSSERSCAALRMTLLHRLRLTRNSS